MAALYWGLMSALCAVLAGGFEMRGALELCRYAELLAAVCVSLTLLVTKEGADQ